MKLKERNNRIYFLLIFLLVLSVDQLSKFLAKYYFSIICNSKLAFGVGLGGTAFSLLALIVILWLITKEKGENLKLLLAIIFAAGASNFLDRIIFGCVRDFVNLGFIPLFNFADAMITLAVIGIFVNLLRNKQNES